METCMSSDGVRLGRFLQTNASEEFNGLRGVTPQPVTIDLSAVDEDDRWEVESARLQDFNLKNCTIIGARFTRAAFGQINLDRVVFRGCIFNSCTFIAERPNDVVFEEFKGTGNMEVRLDRELAERRVYPAIHIPQSGTRNDDRLYHPDEFQKVVDVRKQLAGLPIGDALVMLLENLKKTKTNAEFLLRGLR